MSKHRETFEEFAEEAKEELGDSLKKLILYGSVAREEETEESDIDVFAVVEDKEALELLRDLAYDKGVLENGIAINVHGRTSDEFQGFRKTSYLRNVSSEGLEYA